MWNKLVYGEFDLVNNYVTLLFRQFQSHKDRYYSKEY